MTKEMDAFGCCWSPRCHLKLPVKISTASDPGCGAGCTDGQSSKPSGQFPSRLDCNGIPGAGSPASLGSCDGERERIFDHVAVRTQPQRPETVHSIIAAGALGYLLASTAAPWTIKATGLLVALVFIFWWYGGRARKSCEGFDAAEAALVAAESREIRNTMWRGLGLRDSEVSKVRELVFVLRAGSDEGSPSNRSGSRGLVDTRPYYVDFVTAWRFLRAHEWDVTRAAEAIKWADARDEEIQAAMCEDLQICEQLFRHWRGQGFSGTDVDGDPVLWERPGVLDWQGLASVDEDLLVHSEMIALRQLSFELNKLTVEEQRPVHRIGVVVDLEGLPMSFARPQNLKLIRRLIKIDSGLCPETLKWVLLINPPSKFETVWKVIAPYFAAGTRHKISLVSRAKTQAVLQQHVLREFVPRFLGGPSRQPRLSCAGKVPRKFLRTLEQRGMPDKPSRLRRMSSFSQPDSAANTTGFKKSSRSRLMKFANQLRTQWDFATKLESFPRSEWDGPGGAIPVRHSWGLLKDLSAFGLPQSVRAAAGKNNGQLMELLDVDIFRSNPDDPILQAYDHPALAPRYLRRHGEKRFLFVVNWIIGPCQQVVVGALARPHPDAAQPGSVEDWRLLSKFLSQAEPSRGRSLRVSAACFEGPSFVKDMLSAQKAQHVGRFLPSFQQGEDYIEATIHLTSSEMRRLSVVFQHSYHLIVNGLTYYLCGVGNSKDRPLFAHYCSFVDVQKLRQV